MTAGEVMKKCRKCGGPHFTYTCSAEPSESASAAAGGMASAGASGDGSTMVDGFRIRRGAGTGAGGFDDENKHLRTVKIANLSTEATEDDVRELFAPFGFIGERCSVWFALHSMDMRWSSGVLRLYCVIADLA